MPPWAKRVCRVPQLHPHARLQTSLLIIFLCLCRGTLAQLDPVRNFCRRFGHQTAVIDRKLYIDGGFINYNPISQYPANYSNTGLLYHDLDTPGAGRMPQLYANLTKNSTIPTVHGGTLWADDINKRFYLFAGEYYQQPPTPQFSLWSFDTIYNTWESFGSPAEDGVAAVSYGAGVSVSEIGEGFYYGGWKSNNTVPGWSGPPKAVSALVRYNMDSNTWSTDNGPDSVGRAEGSMVFIPIGDGGMLVYFGGVQDPHGNGTWIGQPMTTILLYDVLSSKWYTQNATGDVPQMRRRFCAGSTWASDQSSYNIYLYGGEGVTPDTPGFDDVYVLSIPSFQWIKLYPPDGNVTGPYLHHSLTCNVVGKAQMVVIGGTFPTTNDCDAPSQYGFHNLDLGEQNREKALWQIFTPNLTDYTVPAPILAAIGGSNSGDATKTAPVGGFSNSDLRVLMTRQANVPTRTPTRSIPNATGSPGRGQPLPTGAIAGLAVGCVVALIAFVIAIILIRRCRYRRRHDLPQAYAANSQSQAKRTLHASTHEWGSSRNTQSLSTTQTPSSHNFQSPFLVQHPEVDGNSHSSRPAELPVRNDKMAPPDPGTTSWLSPDDNPYTPGPAAAAAAVSSESVGPETRIDAEGRLWVQVPRHSGAGGILLSPSSHGHGSPGGNVSPAGERSGSRNEERNTGWWGRYFRVGGQQHKGSSNLNSNANSPVVGVTETDGLPSHGQQGREVELEQPVAPQELSGEPRLEGDGPWEEREEEHGRPKHLTFYHP
ncbi:hypothetical protein B0J18DRAFT_397906 [Chaetomium sp. MPI-SDFR-AT-0129]|nr:hypothetical protein B0J18DRAFT_397906 [Chaetomium sp. MPI-SDFR-AT-0129]